MSSLLSVVEICNIALSFIGAERITSLGDDSEQANLCNLNYATLRDVVLESREWTFAVGRFTLLPTGVTPEFDWSQEFNLPSEVLRTLTVEGAFVGGASGITSSSIEREQMNWVREGNKILADYESISLRAIVRIEDTSLFSALFIHALAARIAADLAIPITRSKVLQSQMFNLYMAKLGDAASADGMQGRSKRIRSRYLAARR